MCFAVEGGGMSGITNKWELAQRISGHSKAPEQALKSIFTGAMQALEGVTKTKFENSMTQRVWNVVSEERLKTLRETLILEFCDKILGTFNDDETAIMLEEHKRTGAVRNVKYSFQIRYAYANNQNSIIDAVVKKAAAMTEEWIPEIVGAVKQEGVELPGPKSF
jgi:hypothetical protein